MHTILTFAAAGALLLAGCTAVMNTPSPAELKQEVLATERAFAQSMADRDFEAFASFLSEECIFFSGPTPLRGKAEVSAAWKRYYSDPAAPFSWEPGQVEVLDSGDLALSTGPVYDPAGTLIATFTSIWRREAPGTWRIIFDRGNDVCENEHTTPERSLD